MSDESTLAGYPSHFNAVFHVALEGTHLRLGMQIHNTGNRPVRFGLGYHPYFRVDNKRGVRIETDATRAFNNVTRKIEPFSGFDFTQPEVDLHLMDQTQTASRMTFDDGSAILVSGSEEFTYWVVWSVAGKPYICLEPWTCPGNALNTGERLIELASGESRHCWVDIGYEKNGAAQREL
jgi:galactose mutarotase-like enzyme